MELEAFLRDLQAGRTVLINDDNRLDQAVSTVIDCIRANSRNPLAL